MDQIKGKGFIIYNKNNPEAFFKAGSADYLYDVWMGVDESEMPNFIDKIEKKIIKLEKQNKKGLKK